jgi:hypothetical protein
MYKSVPFTCLFIFFLFALQKQTVAQQIDNTQDTFFLAKKNGLLGRLGKSISTFAPDDVPQKVVNPFLKYKGKIIRKIELVRLGFECSIYDTCEIKDNLGIRLANTFHKNSREKVIRNNLFFEEGGRVYPYLIADNERYLRDLSYIQDARIIIEFAQRSTDSVDIFVLTKDVFSLGGKLKIDSRTKGRAEVQDENIGGSATKIFLSGFYDEPRHSKTGYSAEITKRNVKGSFVDWTTGFSNFAPSFSSGRREVTTLYTRFEKPLVTPYIPSTGAIEAYFNQTNNQYISDSLYKTDFRYGYYNIDGWLGYSLDSKRSIYANKEIRVHKFVAIRSFNLHFLNSPSKSKDTFDYRFTNSTGILASINVFKQSFYKTNFIYGFGRNEDVPEGFSAVFTGGYVVQKSAGFFIKQNIKRPYAGLDFNLANFKKRGFHSNFTLRAGSFFNQKRFEDMDLLFNVEHFTSLKKINTKWYQRTFITTGITAQINPVFNAPLFLNSIYGLPYFNPENINSDLRSTIKVESVFYNLKKIMGFRFAPFVFSDFSLLKPTKGNFNKSDGFSAVGGGVRTRNENLVFGTMELKAYYFPRTNGDMNIWKIELNTNIRFKYNSTFIKRPDFVLAN